MPEERTLAYRGSPLESLFYQCRKSRRYSGTFDVSQPFCDSKDGGQLHRNRTDSVLDSALHSRAGLALSIGVMAQLLFVNSGLDGQRFTRNEFFREFEQCPGREMKYRHPFAFQVFGNRFTVFHQTFCVKLQSIDNVLFNISERMSRSHAGDFLIDRSCREIVRHPIDINI